MNERTYRVRYSLLVESHIDILASSEDDAREQVYDMPMPIVLLENPNRKSVRVDGAEVVHACDAREDHDAPQAKGDKSP